MIETIKAKILRLGQKTVYELEASKFCRTMPKTLWNDKKKQMKNSFSNCFSVQTFGRERQRGLLENLFTFQRKPI